MTETAKTHTLFVDGNKVVVTGIEQVLSIFDKEICLNLGDKKLSIKGDGLSADKLDVNNGAMTAKCQKITSVSYFDGGKKFSFKGMFK